MYIYVRWKVLKKRCKGAEMLYAWILGCDINVEYWYRKKKWAVEIVTLTASILTQYIYTTVEHS